jgi:hypothetical protein
MSAVISNVFEAILEYGHDEDFNPIASKSFFPTDAPAGSPEKVEVLRRRAELGHPLWHKNDRNDYGGLGFVDENSDAPFRYLPRINGHHNIRNRGDLDIIDIKEEEETGNISPDSASEIFNSDYEQVLLKAEPEDPIQGMCRLNPVPADNIFTIDLSEERKLLDSEQPILEQEEISLAIDATDEELRALEASIKLPTSKKVETTIKPKAKNKVASRELETIRSPETPAEYHTNGELLDPSNQMPLSMPLAEISDDRMMQLERELIASGKLIGHTLEVKDSSEIIESSNKIGGTSHLKDLEGGLLENPEVTINKFGSRSITPNYIRELEKKLLESGALIGTSMFEPITKKQSEEEAA